MTRHVRAVENVAPRRPYSPAVVVDEWVYLSGHVPVDGNGGIVGDNVTDQAIQVLRNLEFTLEAAGSSLEGLVATTVYLTDMAYIDEVDAAYRSVFGEGPYPSRTTVGIAELGRDEFRIEISAIGRTRDLDNEA